MKKWRASSGLARILANSGWMMAEQILYRLVSLLVGVWVARHLGPTDFGRLGFAVAFASLFGIFATLGLNRIIVRELVSHSDDPGFAGRLLSTVLAMRLVAALAMFVVCVCLAYAIERTEAALVATIAAGFVFSASDFIELFFQSRMQARTTALARSVAYLLVVGARIVLLLQGASLQAFAILAFVEIAAASAAVQIAFHLKGFSFRKAWVDWALAGRLLAESWPEIIGGFSGLILMRIDQVMLQSLAGSQAVGVFVVAARLSEAWYFIPSAIISSVYPSIVKLRLESTESYLRRLHHLMMGLVALGYAVILLSTLFGRQFIIALYGAPYAESAQVFVVHIWCGLLMSLGMASGCWLASERLIVLNLYRNLTGAFVNIVLNVVLIPKFGAVGAAYGTASSMVVAYLLFDAAPPRMRFLLTMKLRALVFFPVRIPRLRTA